MQTEFSHPLRRDDRGDLPSRWNRVQLMDPADAARALWILLDGCQRGCFGRERPAVFVHTDGVLSNIVLAGSALGLRMLRRRAAKVALYMLQEYCISRADLREWRGLGRELQGLETTKTFSRQ